MFSIRFPEVLTRWWAKVGDRRDGEVAEQVGTRRIDVVTDIKSGQFDAGRDGGDLGVFPSSSSRGSTSGAGDFELRERRRRDGNGMVNAVDPFRCVGGDGHVVVELGDEGGGEMLRTSVYLKRQLNTMYFLGMSRYKTWSGTGRTSSFFDIMQKILFCIIVCASIFYSICEAKFQIMLFVTGGKYTVFVNFAYHVVCFVVKLYAIKQFAFSHKQADAMVSVIERYEENYPTDEKSAGWLIWNLKLAGGLGVLTLILALLTPLFKVGFTEWKIEKQMLRNSHELSEDIFLWGMENYGNITSDLEKEYGTVLTWTNIALGSTVLLRNYSAYLFVGVVLDVMIICGLVMLAIVVPFMQEVKHVTENVPEENTEPWNDLQASREALWWKFKALKKVIRAINGVFGPLLEVMHLLNLLMFAYVFADFIFEKNKSSTVKIMNACNLIKAELAYFVAGTIAKQNNGIRTWIRNWANNETLHTGKIRLGERHLDASIILDELKEEPLVLGQGNSQIHPNFHFKLLGLATSLFFSMADDLQASSS